VFTPSHVVRLRTSVIALRRDMLLRGEDAGELLGEDAGELPGELLEALPA
jgi:hypothetical protein